MGENLLVDEYLEEVLPRDGYAGLRVYCGGGAYCWCRVEELHKPCRGSRLTYCELATEAEIAALEAAREAAWAAAAADLALDAEHRQQVRDLLRIVQVKEG